MRDVVVQDLCPGRLVEHGLIAADAVAYALARDALDHRGPVDPSRIGASVCGQGSIGSSLGPLTQGADFVSGIPVFYSGTVTEEPPLRCYLDPAC